MSDIDPPKVLAAHAAAALVESGMTVGLGSGTTASAMIRELGRRLSEEGLDFLGVATSMTSANLAASLGIRLRELDDVGILDLNLDGADEVDPRFRMIKGRGGALLPEKIVVSCARRRVTIVTAKKCVERLGMTMPLPVEVSSFGLKHTERGLAALGAVAVVRRQLDGVPFVTDGGNAIIDCQFAAIEDPVSLDLRLRGLPGVLQTGLFLGLCDVLIIGHADHVETVLNEVWT